MSYTPIFQKPYPDGWENLPSEDTPITAEVLDGYDDAIVNIEDYLENNAIPTDIEDLGDINITTPTDGQALIYDSASNKWVNGAGGGGSSTLSGLTDVTISSVQNGQVLKYDSTASKWINAAESGGGGGTVGIADIYTETERQVGLWKDSKPLYQKTIDCGTLPNATTKTVAHGVSNIEHIHILDANAKNTTTGLTLPLPYISTTNINQTVKVYCNDTNIYLETAIDYSAYTKSNVTIQYTKTNDSATTLIPSSASAIYMMGDVAISSVANGQILKYNSTSQKWENSAESAGGGSSITITTFDSSLYGETVTLSDGTTTLTTTFSNSGEAVFSGVTLTGTLTIACDIYSMMESVPYFGNYDFALTTIPDGSTVTPTDVIQTWLACAGITDKSYTTLNEVLADSTTLLALISDNNAVDYLVRSTTWASGITADSTAMTDIGANNYCANTLLSDSTWRNAIANSSYIESVLNVKVPTMTSNTTPSGEAFSIQTAYSSFPQYMAFDGNNTTRQSPINTGLFPDAIGYKFTSSVIICAAYLYPHDAGSSKAIGSFKIQATNNTASWTDLYSDTFDNSSTYEMFTFENHTAYTYYRIYVESTPSNYLSLCTLQFYGRANV